MLARGLLPGSQSWVCDEPAQLAMDTTHFAPQAVPLSLPCRFARDFEPEVQARSTAGLKRLRDLCEAALVAAGLHITEAGKLWGAYRSGRGYRLLQLLGRFCQQRGCGQIGMSILLLLCLSVYHVRCIPAEPAFRRHHAAPCLLTILPHHPHAAPSPLELPVSLPVCTLVPLSQGL